MPEQTKRDTSNDEQPTTLVINNLKDALILANLVAVAAGALNSEYVFRIAMKQLIGCLNDNDFSQEDMRDVIKRVYDLTRVYSVKSVMLDPGMTCPHCECPDDICCWCDESKSGKTSSLTGGPYVH